MKLWLHLAAGMAVVMTLAGCGHSYESQLIGTWKPRATSVLANTLHGAVGGSSPQTTTANAQAMATMSLDIRDDKTFTLTVGTPVEGTWTMDEDTGVADMTFTKVGGKDIPKTAGTPPAKVTCQLDTSTSTLTFKNPDPNSAGLGGISDLNFEKS